MGSNREKFKVDIAILEKWTFGSTPKIISQFRCTNIIFADSTCLHAIIVSWTKKRKLMFFIFGPSTLFKITYFKIFCFDSLLSRNVKTYSFHMNILDLLMPTVIGWLTFLPLSVKTNSSASNVLTYNSVLFSLG